MNYVKALQTYGVRGTLERLYQFRQIKFGRLVGSDELGNKYYENLDLPYGQHRWVEPKHGDSPSLYDASSVSPTWHGWLHHTTDLVPKPVGQVPERTGLQLEDDVSTPVRHHYNAEHTRTWRPNPTLHRERGFGVDHHYGKAGENDFYVQPSHMQNADRVELGPKIEPWTGAPSARKSVVEVPKEEWELFLEKRKQMNAERRK